MAVLVTATKAEPALVVGLVQLSSVNHTVNNSNNKCCFSATNYSRNCNHALAAFCCLGYNIYIEQEETMTLDQLIFHLDVIRAQAGHGRLQVLFRDPGIGMLYDEIHPALCEVESTDNLDMFDAFDLTINDFYVEL